MATIRFSGEFAVWSYVIGHGQLLLRRTKSNEHPTRVDILLKDVGWMCLPTTFTGLEIRVVPSEEIRGLLTEAGSPRERERKAFLLSGDGWKGHVLAGALAVHEDDGEYNDPSALLG